MQQPPVSAVELTLSGIHPRPVRAELLLDVSEKVACRISNTGGNGGYFLSLLYGRGTARGRRIRGHKLYWSPGCRSLMLRLLILACYER